MTDLFRRMSGRAIFIFSAAVCVILTGAVLLFVHFSGTARAAAFVVARTGGGVHPAAPDAPDGADTPDPSDTEEPAQTAEPLPAPDILPLYADAYAINNNMIGWLYIEDTVVDYPVVQTLWDETYYLRLSFYGEPDTNGCLIMDTDSVVGSGTAEYLYQNGTRPSTNLIIHGHNMRSGQMFGGLKLYADPEYGSAHSLIRFDSLYEQREYELIAVFYSQVFYADEDVFKYYKFFQADTEEAFLDWYTNIKQLSLYDTGVEAAFGDEFLTLSCCSYHVEDGRFVVVAKRVK